MKSEIETFRFCECIKNHDPKSLIYKGIQYFVEAPFGSNYSFELSLLSEFLKPL